VRRMRLLAQRPRGKRPWEGDTVTYEMVVRPMTAGEVRVGDRLLRQAGRPLVIFARTLRGETTIRCDRAATITTAARTPMGDVERRTLIEHVEPDIEASLGRVLAVDTPAPEVDIDRLIERAKRAGLTPTFTEPPRFADVECPEGA